MKNFAVRSLVILIILALSLSTVAFASMEASYYLSSYGAYISKTGNTVEVNFDVQGTGIMDKIGATEIYLFERTDSYSSWMPVQVYLYTNPVYEPSMMNSYSSFKDDYVTYAGNSSYQYMAYITVYAEKDGGSDSRNLVVYS